MLTAEMEIKLSILCSYFVFIVLKTLCLSGVASAISVEVNITSNDPTNQGLPNDINVTFTTGTNTSTEFRMIRVDYDNLTIYSIETDKDGQKITKENVSSNEDVAFYQDTNKGAVFQLYRPNGDEGQSVDFIIMHGQYQQGNVTYSIEPTLRPKREASQNNSQSDQRYESKPVLTPPITMSDYLNPPPEKHFSIPTNTESRYAFGSKFKRQRRQAFSTYYIDVTAFLDSTSYSRFYSEAAYDSVQALKKIREYYAFIFTGIDLIYQNFQSTKFQLRVRLTKVVIFKTTFDFSLTYMTLRSCLLAYPYTCKYISVVNTEAVLNSFSLFLSSTSGKDLVFPYDHAMLFIGDDMYASTTDILGLAWVETICRTDGMSSSAIEDTGDYSAIFTGAHELGHSLSAKHDGTDNSCSKIDRYLMAPSDSDPTGSSKQNPWRFSSCTVNYLVTYLTNLAGTASGRTCLSNTLDVIGDFPDVSHRLLGQDIPAEKQCQLRFGTSSYVCQDTTLPDICPGMYCYNPSLYSKCFSQAPLSGTTCGCGKVCNQGLCVTDSLAPDCGLQDVSSNCTTDYCYDSSLRNLCQRTCSGYITATPATTKTTTTVGTTKKSGCYDDATFYFGSMTCSTLDPYYCTYSSVNQSCCSTCRQRTTTAPESGCYDDATFYFGSMTCSTIDPSYCTYSSVNQSCCSTCRQKTTTTTPDYWCYDDSTFTYYGETCRTIPPSFCTYYSVSQSCCRKCRQGTTTVPNYCYDDVTFTYAGLSCQRMTTGFCSITSVSQACCSLCRQTMTTVPATAATCQDDPKFNMYGESCYSAMLSSTNYCYDASVNKSCCASCAKRFTRIPGCEFGDRDRNLCSSVSSCRSNRHDCCYTCGSAGILPNGMHLLVWNLATLVLLYINMSK